MKAIFAFFALLFLTQSGATGQTPSQAKYFDAAIEMAVGGKIFAKPRLIIKEGSNASIIADRPDGYALRLSLDAPSRSDSTNRTVSITLYLPEAGKWVLVARPTLTTEVNRTTSINYQRVGRSPLGLKLTLNDNFDGKLLSSKEWGKNACSLAKLAAWEARMSKAVQPAPKLSKIQFEQIGGTCCSAGCNMTCCSDGPICCSDPYICEGGAQCCNHR